MKTRDEYLESMRQLKRRVYILGEQIECPNEHPLVEPSTHALAESYAMAHEEPYHDLFTATSHLSNETVNRFTHVHQSAQDLVRKVDMLRAQGRRTATCFQRCAGLDGLNTMYAVTYETDRLHQTSYHTRFKTFLQGVQERDEVVAACMTDPKGDRRLRPSQQPDPDLYLRVVERRPDGVIINGAKCHITGAINSHQLLVISTRRLKPDEGDWAISFAIPADTDGVSFVLGRQPGDTRRLEPGKEDVGNCRYGGHEALVIFDHVFVPHDHIFMDGETEMTDPAIGYFGSFHRTSYGGCKSGIGDNVTGAASLIAKANGARHASHIKAKLAEMVQLNEVLYACGTAASIRGFATPSGGWCSDFLLANVCKLNVTRHPYEIARLATDLAGGLMVTMPSAADFKQEAVGELVQKYLIGSSAFSVEQRRKLLRYLENAVLGPGGVSFLAESLHGAGSPQAQMMQIQAEAPFEEMERGVRRLLDLGDSLDPAIRKPPNSNL